MAQALIALRNDTRLTVGITDVFDCTALCAVKPLPGNRTLYIVSASDAQMARLRKLPGPLKDLDWKAKPAKDAVTREIATDADIDKAQTMRELLPYHAVADRDAVAET